MLDAFTRQALFSSLAKIKSIKLNLDRCIVGGCSEGNNLL